MNNQTRTKKSFRFSSLLALVLFLNQFVFISFASAMSNIFVFDFSEEGGYHYTNELQNATGIETYLNSHSEFEQVDTADLQYKKADYIDANYLSDYSSITNFKESVRGTPAGGETQYIPIMVGDITTFITMYPMLEQKMVGDEYINTRLVLNQIEAKLGRNLITSTEQPRYATEKEQFNALINNAKSMATSMHTLRYGEPYLANGFGSPSMDMIWPELREINGQAVIVPIVYLTASTINSYKVKGNTVQLHNGALVKRATVNGVDISLGRGAFLKAIEDITLTNSSVNSTGAMELIAGGTLSLLSSQVRSDNGDLLIAGQSIHAETILHRYDFGNETGTRYGNITEINSEGNVILRSYGDLNFYGVQVNAGEGITIAADGSIYIGSQPLQSSYSGREGRWKVERSEVEYLTSKLSAEDTIKILASGQTTISGAEIVSDKGHIEIMGAMGITVIDDTGQYQSKQKGKFGKKKVNESVYQTVAIRSVLDAGKGIKLSSEFGDITLRSVEFTSQEGTEIKATSGGVNLLMSSETDHYSYSSVKKSMWNTVTRQKGHNKETGVPNAIVGGFAVEAFNGVVVEFVGDPNLSVNAQLDELSNIPALSYLSELRDRDDVDFEAVLNVDDSWKKSQKTLSPAAIAVITIAVAVAAGPAAAGVAGTVGGGVAGVVASAAFTSLVTTAALSLANGNSIEKTLASLSSDENLRSLAVTMVTAGAIAQIDASFFTADSVNIDAAIASNGTQASVDAALNTQTSLSLQAQVAQAATHSAVRAGVNTLAYGGDFSTQFAQSLTQQGINVLGQHMANKIGAAFDTSKAGSLDTALKYISHAGSGCMLGVVTAANSGSSKPESACGAGAGGAVIGEFIGSQFRSSSEITEAKESLEGFVNENGELIADYRAAGMTDAQIIEQLNSTTDLAYYTNQLEDLRNLGVDLARLGAAVGVFAAGASAQNIHIGSDLGANAAENNALFLFLAVPVLLTAIDIAIQVNEIMEIVELFEQGKNEEANQRLVDMGIEAIVGLVIPGDKILSHIAKKAPEMGQNIDAVLGAVRDKLSAAGKATDLPSTSDIPSSHVIVRNGIEEVENIQLTPTALAKTLNGDNRLKGGHSTNSGAVEVIDDLRVDSNEVRDAQVSINGVNKTNGVNKINGEKGYSTLFPEGWSDEKIVREFSEGLKSGSTVLGPFGRETVTPSGVTIRYFVMKGRIDTFFPVFTGAPRRGQ